ncbi:hypothetical protein RvY_17332 [Ramazzottius varieornatus]|uniref:Uncharacterized protein n=1 Tax=Ramazzottius varieornatus TaxID=947166 RepID=A0A1D1W2L1_RAMVA|nr:hypothetical protein RvY_17332 [Ramazzottius varieornatus]
MGDDIREPLCKVVIAEGKKLREEEARNPLLLVPNFHHRRRPRLLMPIQPEVEEDPEFAHLAVKPIKKTPEYVRPPRDTWDEEEFFRTEVDYKAPVRQRFLSELGWAYFDLLVERNRVEEETGVKQPRSDPDKFMMEVWLPKQIKKKEEAARGQTGQDSKSVK